MNRLTVLINQVEAFVRAGSLSAEQGQQLIDSAHNVIAQLEAA